MAGILSAASGLVRNLAPGYFALVMATGIVSIGASQHGYDWLGLWLFKLNGAQYAILWVLLLARIVFFPRQVAADFQDPSRSAGFFSLVAGTEILAGQFFSFERNLVWLEGLWWLGAAVWIALTYAFFVASIAAEVKLDPKERSDGAWLLIAVATQSLSLSATFLFEIRHAAQGYLAVGLLAFLLGTVLYYWLLALVSRRLLFYRVRPEQLTPPYWITMGGAAISTLAGSELLGARALDGTLAGLAPFVAGTTIALWTTATWLLPLLLLLAIWRSVVHRVPITYGPGVWDIVFPLGMYSAATFELARDFQIPVLIALSRGFWLAAIASWAWAFVGLIRAVAKASKAELSS